MTGWLQQAIAWLLLEYGVLTRIELHALIDSPASGITGSLDGLRKAGLLAALPNRHGDPSQQGARRKVYGLTRPGIELALALTAPSGLRRRGDKFYQLPKGD